MSNNLENYRVYPLLSSIEPVSDFDSGLAIIDDFLVKEAFHSDQEYRTQTCMLESNQTIIGLFASHVGTLRLQQVDIASFKDNGVLTAEDLQKDETMGGDSLIYPVVVLDFFAIDQSFQDCGNGTFMLEEFLHRVLDAYVQSGLGIAGVVLDALPNAADFYKKAGFSALHGKDSDSLTLQSYPMFISTKKIVDVFTN